MKLLFQRAIHLFTLISALLLTASLVYSYPVQRYFYYLFFSAYFIEILVDRKWKYIKWDKKRGYFILLILFISLAFVYMPFEGIRKYTWIILDRRLALLGFGVVGLFGVNRMFKLSYFLNTFIISAVIAICYLLFYRIGILEFIVNPARETAFTETRIAYVNNHMSFNLYLNIALVSIWYILKKSVKSLIWWETVFYITSLAIIIYILFISEGRTGFVTAQFLFFSFILMEILRRNKKMGIIFGILSLIMAFAFINHHKRMSENEVVNDPRKFLWKAAVQVIRDKPLLGYGISSAQEHFDTLRIKYQTPAFASYAKKIRSEQHCHNQFLQTTMEFGLFGTLILLTLLVVPMLIAEKGRRLLSFFIFLPGFYQSIFDIALTGLGFSAVWGILMIMMLSMQNDLLEN